MERFPKMQENKKAYFSVIITVFNLENYIERGILSVLKQSFQDYELIIVNDGSTDNSLNVINELPKKNQKIKIINHEKNESQLIARINGVQISQGKYIIFLDGDDLFIKDAFITLYNIIQKNPDYDIYEYGFLIKSSGQIVLPIVCNNDRFTSFFNNKYSSPLPSMVNKVYNADIIKHACSKMERAYININQDSYQSIIISYYAKTCFYINMPIFYYSYGLGVSTSYRNLEKTVEYLEASKKVIYLVEIFLSNNNLDISLDNLKFRKLAYTIDRYIMNQENIDDRKKLITMLPKYYDLNIILDYLYEVKEEINKIKLTYSTKYYKFGEFFLSPIRKLKHLIMKLKK